MTIVNDLIYRGSVKDIYREDDHHLVFSFSDRYSVFDWGEMPDLIPEKGQCLSLLASYFFDVLSDPTCWLEWSPSISLSEDYSPLLNDLRKQGLRHHFIGESQSISHGLKVKKFQVPEVKQGTGAHLTYDYSYYQDKVTNTLIPLEVIFRFGVPEGASILKRRSDLHVGDRFDLPLIEFSTKLEKTDRYISEQEAKEMAGFTQEEMSLFVKTITLLALRLKDLFAKHEVELWDGKFEFSFGAQREFVLVDSIGPDELRLMVDGVALSKEFLRQYYVDSRWKQDIDVLKKECTKTWKEKALKSNVLPEKLDPHYLKTFSSLYKSLTNKMTGNNVFSETQDLRQVVQEMKACGDMRSL